MFVRLFLFCNDVSGSKPAGKFFISVFFLRTLLVLLPALVLDVVSAATLKTRTFGQV